MKRYNSNFDKIYLISCSNYKFDREFGKHPDNHKIRDAALMNLPQVFDCAPLDLLYTKQKSFVTHFTFVKTTS